MLTVRVGSSNATAGGEVLPVAEIFFHPNYKPQTLEFNLAVLKLHRNLSFGKPDAHVDSIAYSTDKLVPVDNHILFLGWGSVLVNILLKICWQIQNSLARALYGEKLREI